MIQQAIVVVDRDLNLLYVNKAAERLSGWKAEEALGRPVTEFMIAPPEWVEARRRIFETGEPWSDEITIPRGDGTAFCAEVDGSPLLSETGEIIGLIAVASDITERKREEEASRESEERYYSLFENMTEGFALLEVIFDADGKPQDLRYLAVNPAHERRTGLKAEDVIGRTILELFPAATSISLDPALRVMAGEPLRLEERFQPLDRWFEISVFKVDERRLAAAFQDITERKQAEEALRESEQRWRGLFETMREGFILAEVVFDEDGCPVDQRCLDVNHALEQIVGLKREEMVGRTYREVFPAGDLGAWGDPVVRALTGESVHFEWYGAGTGHNYEIFLHSPCSGQIAAFVVNVDERLRAQQTLRESEERLRRACKAGRIGLYEWNSTTDVAYANPEVEEIFGLEAGLPASFKTWMAGVHPEDRERMTDVAELIEQAHAEKRPLPRESEYRIVRPDGKLVWIQTKDVVAVEDGDVVVRGAVVDVTECKRMEDALRESEDRLRRAVRSGRIGLFEWNASRNIEFLSREAYDLFGYDAENPANFEQLFSRVHPDERAAAEAEFAKLLERARGGERDISDLYQHRVVHDDDTTHWLEARATVDLEGGNIVMRGTVRDITEQKQAEEQLERLRSEFYGVVSHELKTPLTVIKGTAAVGLSRLAFDDQGETRELFNTISDQSDRLAEMVNNLLDMTRIEAGTFAVEAHETDIADVVTEAVRSFQRAGYGHRIEVRLNRRLPRIKADKRRVVQVLSNLLDNAAKFSPSHRPVTIHAKQDGDSVVFSVRDRGMGIAADKLPLLFKKYSQLSETSRGGTGLGLWISASVIEAHGGRIWAESAGPNKGATFSFTLSKLGAAEPHETDAVGSHSLSILAVDDEPSILRFVERFLTVSGHRVVTTTDPFQVRGLVETEEPDVLVLDMKMPGKSGVEVLQEIREFSEVPVVIITATDNEQEVAQARSFKGVTWLPKPFAPDELLRHVTIAGERSRRSRARS